MNIVNKLTMKHMLMNRRRTLVTIVGVIISTAMITAVATISLSFLDMMVRDSIARNGLWHVQYVGVDADQLSALREDPDTQAVSVKRDVGWAEIADPKSIYRPYLFVQEFNSTAFENMPVHLREGRLPENSGELVVTEGLLKREKGTWQVGDTLTLNLGERIGIGVLPDTGEPYQASLGQYNSYMKTTADQKEYLKPLEMRTYTIVGIIETPSFEYSSFPGYTCLSYLDPTALAGTGSGSRQPADYGATCRAYVILKAPDVNLFGHAKEMAKELGVSEYEFNNDLLRYMGIVGNDQVRSTLTGLSIVIMGIIIIGSVSLIYNAFAISVSERFRHLGMLSSVGATARQKRNSVFFEGLVIGLISIPIGIASGIAGIEITFRFINPTMKELLTVQTELHALVSPGIIAAAVLLSALTIFISVYAPARRAAKVAPIDAIRQTTDVKLTGRTVRTSKLTAKIFGIEGDVALKNLKRNRRRYKATVFSLVISLVLFLSVSYFGDNLKRSYQMTTDDIEYDTHVNIYQGAENAEALVAEIRNAAYADSSVEVRELYFETPESSDFLQSRVIALDDDSLRDYAGAAGVDVRTLLDPDAMAAVVVNTITYIDDMAGKYVTKTVIEPKFGEKWSLYSSPDTQEEGSEMVAVDELTMAGFTDELPVGVSTKYAPKDAVFVVSMAVQDKLISKLEENSLHAGFNHTVYLSGTEPLKLAEELEAMDQQDIYVFSVAEMRRSEEQMMFLMGVFVYGFITLITLICAANIFNTISTSVALRRREFAMLRSIGMTPGGFGRMIRYESIFYGLKALIYGLPLSLLVMLLLYRSLANSFDYPFLIPWKSVAVAVLAVFLMVFSTMVYASAKIKKENIIESLREETI
ncbi:ABC transporter permease [Bacilliculturomica massiliensis]|uniref:ABC transporter permease n=1 Tax=Bacilliculturomica massiliensis TaxID=1917867 RepID=UPI00102FC48C|nr:ABC transporter permease [Bacilliculturomica massiliensis]